MSEKSPANRRYQNREAARKNVGKTRGYTGLEFDASRFREATYEKRNELAATHGIKSLLERAFWPGVDSWAASRIFLSGATFLR